MADAITTFNLMLRIVESYNLGDTMTVRAGISALLSAPINYKSSARHTINTDTLGRTNVVRSGDVVGIAFSAGKKKDAKKGTTVHYMLKKALKSDEELTGNKDAMFNQLFNQKEHWVEVAGINDSTPINVWHAPNGDNLKKQKL